MLMVTIDPNVFAKLDALSDQIEQAIVATNVDLWNDCVEGTPVDLGYARASWFATLDTVGPHPSPPTEGMAAPPPPTPAALVQSAGRKLMLANSAAYIRVLEYSSPPHSPQGNAWVRASVAKYESNLTRHLRELGLIR